MSKSEQAESSSGLYRGITVLWRLSVLVLGWIVIVVSLNWLSDFLHAPLGIKDHPPEPGIVVQCADLAFWPVGISYVILRVLRTLTKLFSAQEVLLGCAGIGFSVLLTASLIGELLHREFVPGTHYVYSTIAPYIINGVLFLCAAGLLLADLFCAYSFIANWKTSDTGREKIASVLIASSTIPAVVAFAGICIPREHDLTYYAIWAVFLVIAAIALLPKSVQTSQPQATAKPRM